MNEMSVNRLKISGDAVILPDYLEMSEFSSSLLGTMAFSGAISSKEEEDKIWGFNTASFLNIVRMYAC